MTGADLTDHARRRLQQRAIPLFVLDRLEEFGSVVHCCGADRMIFDKKAKKRLRRHYGGRRGAKDIERWLSVYAVIGAAGKVITVSHQTRRIWRD